MGRDDPVMRVGKMVSGAEMGNKMEGMGWGVVGGDLELLWIKNERVNHVHFGHISDLLTYKNNASNTLQTGRIRRCNRWCKQSCC